MTGWGVRGYAGVCTNLNKVNGKGVAPRLDHEEVTTDDGKKRGKLGYK
jgi:hypothetical protein